MARAHQYVLNFRVFRQNLAELVERFDEDERDKAAFTLAFASDIRKVVDYLTADADAIAAFETDQVIVVDLTDPLAARWLIETARSHELFHRLGESYFDSLLALAETPAAEATAEAWNALLSEHAQAVAAPSGVGVLLRTEMAAPPAPEPDPISPEPLAEEPSVHEETVQEEAAKEPAAWRSDTAESDGQDHSGGRAEAGGGPACQAVRDSAAEAAQDDSAPRPKRVRRGLISAMVSAARRSDEDARIDSTPEAVANAGDTALASATGPHDSPEGGAPDDDAPDDDAQFTGVLDDGAPDLIAEPDAGEPDQATADAETAAAAALGAAIIAAQTATAEDAWREGAPAQEALAEEPSIEEAPVDETPSEEAPADEAPAEEAPADEAPVEDAPSDETPAEKTPAEDRPTNQDPPPLVEQARELVFWNIGAGSSQLFVEVGCKLLQQRLPALADYFDVLRRLAIGESTRKSVIEQLADARRPEDARWRVFWF